MTETLSKCSLGIFLNEDCHLNTFTKKKTLNYLKNFDKSEIEILSLRLPIIENNFLDTEGKTICSHHHEKYLVRYSLSQKACVDPWKKHTSKVYLQVREINLELAKQSKPLCNNILVPGKKICQNCKFDLVNKIKKYKIENDRCVDPYKRHRSIVCEQLTNLKLEYINYLSTYKNTNYTLQDKVCNACEIKLKTDSECLASESVQPSTSNQTESQHHSDQPADNRSDSQSTDTSGSVYETNSQRKRKFDEILHTFDIPPLKRGKISNKNLKKRCSNYYKCYCQSFKCI